MTRKAMAFMFCLWGLVFSIILYNTTKVSSVPILGAVGGGCLGGLWVSLYYLIKEK